MLLSFRFANHRSFRDEQQLNLTPVYDAGPDRAREASALSVAGIFGPNASGKSNVIDAFRYMRFLVGRSDREVEPGLGLERQPFKLDPEFTSAPSSYVIDLMLNGIRYTYGFVIDDIQITEEWLYSYPYKKSRRIFERNADVFKWGEFTRSSSLTRLAELVAPTALFLSVAARFGGSSRTPPRSIDEDIEALHRVYSWVWMRQMRDRTHLYRDPQLLRWPEDDQRREIIVDLLREADLGLLNVTQREEEQAALFPAPDMGDKIAPAQKPSRVPSRRPELQFHHRGAVSNVLFDMSDESDGTIRLLERAIRAVPVLARGGLLLVDEIDASLHPLLTAKLIGLFQSKAINIRGAQLIFTSHDATLLGFLDGEEVLDRDQIWFTEKRKDGSSILYPLSDFKPRKEGENRMRRYLSGSYGAVPDISMRMFEQALTSHGSESGE